MTRGNGTRGSASTAPRCSNQTAQNVPMLHRSNPPTVIATPCYETSSTHGELAFVVGVADPAGALVHAGDVFRIWVARWRLGTEVSWQSTRTGSLSFSGRSDVPPTFRQLPTCISAAAAGEHPCQSADGDQRGRYDRGQALTKTASAAQAEPVDQRAVPLHVDLGDVLEQTTPPAHQQQQAPP